MEDFSKNVSVQVFDHKPKDFSAQVEVVGCYLEIKGRLLFLQNHLEDMESEKWGVPAGKLESQETLEEAAIRELWEETGIVAPVSFLGAVYIRKPDLDYSYHLFKVCLEKTPEVCLSSEHKMYQWVSKEDLKSLPLMLGAGEALQIYYTMQQGKLL